MAWKDDEGVAQNLKRSEILNFMQHDYDKYRWSCTTLDQNHIDSVSKLRVEGSKCSPQQT